MPTIKNSILPYFLPHQLPTDKLALKCLNMSSIPSFSVSSITADSTLVNSPLSNFFSDSDPITEASTLTSLASEMLSSVWQLLIPLYTLPGTLPSPSLPRAQPCSPPSPSLPITCSPTILITTSNPGIHSVDVPLYAYSLWGDIPDHQNIHNLTQMLCDLHLATVLDSYLDLSSLFHALYQAFLQISQLWSLPWGPLPNPRTQVLNSIERNVEATLFITLLQPGHS